MGRPVEGRIDEHNVEWVADYGKLTAFHVSDEDPYADFIGKTVTRTDDICLDDGKIIGRVLFVGMCEVRIEVGPDELVVTVSYWTARMKDPGAREAFGRRTTERTYRSDEPGKCTPSAAA